MNTRLLQAFLCFGVVLMGGGAGCERKPARTASPEPPTVEVSQPIVRAVTEYADFTGRTDAVESVNVKARTSGYLVHIGFPSGSVVRGEEHQSVRLASTIGVLGISLSPGVYLATTTLYPGRGEGDLLFVIDPRPYQADLDRAAGQVRLAEARRDLAASNYARAKLVNQTPGAISPQEVDRYAAVAVETAAEVEAARANLQVNQLNLQFTRVTSPIDGRIGRNLLTLGNLVSKDESLLTTIVSEDPMYAYFDVDERSVLRIQELLREGKIKTQEKGGFAVWMGLANEPGHPHRGTVDFVNNKVNPLTGTIVVRGVFANPKPPRGPRLLLPGEFVRIHLPLGDPSPAILVADRALATDQGRKYLLVVDEKNVVQYRPVKLGMLLEDGLRVIQEGIKASDWVIVNGLQEVRPRMEANPERVAMPTYPVAAPALNRP